MKHKGKRLILKILAVILAVALIPCALYMLKRLEGARPEFLLDNPISFIGATTTISGTVSDIGNGLASLRVTLMKSGGKEIELLSETYPATGFLGPGKITQKQFSIILEPAKIGLADGEALLRVSVRDRSLRKWANGNLTYFELPVKIDTIAPSISILSRTHYLNQGGAGLVIYRVSEKNTQNGVRVGDKFFRGFGGHFADPDIYLAFFAVSHDQGPDTRILLEAMDQAKNSGAGAFYYHINGKKFRKDTLRVSDRFIQTVLPQFEAGKRIDPDMSLVDRFLMVNQDQRKADYKAATSMNEKTGTQMYWSGPFNRLPKSATRATFADRRDYVYKGKIVDKQVHLGVDLASVAQSPVPAANSGKVVFAGFQGIYGLTVYIDHGFGLLSQYSHLSRIDVTPGQMVDNKEAIGLTGATGLAGGDHLHFGILVGGVFVNPIEWWDKNWVKNNILSKIKRIENRKNSQ